MPRTQKGSNRSSNQGPGQAKGKKQSKKKQGLGNPKQQTAPAAVATKRYSTRPVEKPLNGGGRCLKFQEYVQDISGSVAFSANSFSVQPGLAEMFAWLSVQAPSYQEYRFRSLRFRYETEKSSSTSGKLMMAFQPDAADGVPVNKQEMLENEFKAKCAVWQEIQFSVPCNEALGKRRYIRTADLAANLDIKTYDFGNLVVATNGCADTSAVGELYVEYEIELLTPVLNLQAIAAATSKQITGVSPSQTSFMGTTPTTTSGLDISATGNVVTFNRVGRYLVGVKLDGTGLFTSMSPVTSASTASVTQANGISNAAANAGTVSVSEYVVVVTERGQTMSLVFTTVSTTITASTTRIASFSSA